MYVLLSILTLLPTLAYAETCTPTPDCASLGYTETSCPDGDGVKCPWNTSLMYCSPKCEEKTSCEVKNCAIGDVLYSDKKCYACLANTLPNQVPIGVMFGKGKAVGLVDLSTKDTWDNAKSMCSSYSVGGVSGWSLPIKDELLAIYSNINAVQTGLQNTKGGTKLTSRFYWGATNCGSHCYWIVNPVSGTVNGSDANDSNNAYVRPVIAF